MTLRCWLGPSTSLQSRRTAWCLTRSYGKTRSSTTNASNPSCCKYLSMNFESDNALPLLSRGSAHPDPHRSRSCGLVQHLNLGLLEMLDETSSLEVPEKRLQQQRPTAARPNHLGHQYRLIVFITFVCVVGKRFYSAHRCLLRSTVVALWRVKH